MADDPAPTPAAAPARTAKPAQKALVPADVEAFVEGWWQDHFPGSPVAADTRAWNTAHGAKEEMKKRLKALKS